MQEKGMEADPRYGQLLALARNAQQVQQQIAPSFPSNSNAPLGNGLHTPPSQQPMATTHENEELSGMQGNVPGFSGDQMSQLRNQIMAYKLLSHSQPLTDQIKVAIQSKGASSRMANLRTAQTGTII